MNRYKRTLSAEEARQLKSGLPWFGKRRREFLSDIEHGLADVYEFDITRTWDINGCRPPCCPYTLLFETTEGLFVYVESWKCMEREEHGGSENRLIIDSTPLTNWLFSWRMEGCEQVKHTETLREFNEFFEIDGDAEWKTYRKEELPSDVAAALEAA